MTYHHLMQHPLLMRLVEAVGLVEVPWWRKRYRQGEREVQQLRDLGVTEMPLLNSIRSLMPALIIEMLETDTLPASLSYRYFTRRKRNRKVRLLAEPNVLLKRIQHELVASFLADDRLNHPAAVGYRRKRSIAHHAWAHAGAQTIIVCDVADFFPSTRAWRVEAWWKAQTPYNQTVGERLARVLTLVTTDRDALPQGAPTSPILSNVVNYPLDVALSRKVARTDGVYTRYVDDLVFSWRRGMPDSDFESSVRAILRTYGYRINAGKGWRVYSRDDEPVITGCVLRRDGTVDVPAEIKAEIAALSRSPEMNESRLAGYNGYAAMVRNRPTP